MAWKIEFDPAAQRELKKLEPQKAKRILVFLHSRIMNLDNPRNIGEALKGAKLGELWKYRVGDYRIISAIEDTKLRILIIRIGKRSDVYRQK